MDYESMADAYPVARRALLIGIGINLALAGLKIVVGLLAFSQALVADGIHSFSDLVTDIIVWFGVRMGWAEADENHPFGHGRIETLSSMVVGVVLGIIGAALAYKAGVGLFEGRVTVPAPEAVVVAGVSILAKEWLFHYTRGVGRRVASSALIANAWHHRSDSLSSVAVLIGVGAGVIWPNLAFLDRVAAMVVAGLSMKVAFDVVRGATLEMVDTAPPAEVVQRLTEMARAVPEVLDIRDVKVRQSGSRFLMECKVVVDGRLTLDEAHVVGEQVEAIVKTGEPAVAGVTVHLEPAARD